MGLGRSQQRLLSSFLRRLLSSFYQRLFDFRLNTSEIPPRSPFKRRPGQVSRSHIFSIAASKGMGSRVHPVPSRFRRHRSQADTIGAICGQLAGALYGWSGRPRAQAGRTGQVALVEERTWGICLSNIKQEASTKALGFLERCVGGGPGPVAKSSLEEEVP